MLDILGSGTSRSSAKGRIGAAVALASLAAALVSAPGASEAHPHYSFGGVSKFNNFPSDPGYPEGIAIDGSRVYVSGPAASGTAGSGPSKILVYDRGTKALEQTISIAGETLAAEHALTCVAVDGDGRLYALSTQLGLLRFSEVGGAFVQESYGSPVPDLPACAAAPPGAPCSPVPFDLPPLANDIVFDEDGYAYVTDSFQATIFRYPPGGGAPEIWFQSLALAGGGDLPMGTNGIRLDPSREHAYFTVSTSLADPQLGALYRLPLVEDPEESDLELVHAYDEGEMPDGFAFGQWGDIYVTLAAANAVSVLDPSGAEVTRIVSTSSSPIPLDAPANVAFESWTSTLLIVNHAVFTANPDHFAVLKVWVGDAGDPLEKPSIP